MTVDRVQLEITTDGTITVDAKSGLQGPTGPAGPGVPVGGALNDILAKTGLSNYQTGWTDAPVLDSVTFDQAALETTGIAKLAWNDVDGTLEFGLKGGNVVLPVGQMTVHRVVNRDSVDMTKGQVVKLYGATGQRVGVALAQANNDPNSSKSFGVTAEPILRNQQGFVVSEGFVFNIDTHLLTEGELVWLDPSSPGGLTTTKPTAPNHLVMIGLCVRSQQQTGILFVKVQNGYEVDELHDVRYTNLATGDLLTRTSSSLWENITRTSLAADTSFNAMRSMQAMAVGPTTSLTTGDGKWFFLVPSTLNGKNLVGARAAVTTASSSGTPTIQIANATDAVDMLSTRITIDANELTSYTATVPAVIDTAHDDVATGDLLRVDVDVAGTGTQGLIVYLEFA